MDGQSMDLSSPIEAGRAYIVTGQYGLAVQALNGAVTADPGSARALTLLAVAYDRLHRYDLADRYYGAALAVDPQFVAALNNWGYSKMLRQDLAEAKRLLEQANEARQGDPVVAANLRILNNGDQQGMMAAATGGTADDEAQHRGRVTVLKRVALVRVSPGAQLLVTRPAVASATGGV